MNVSSAFEAFIEHALHKALERALPQHLPNNSSSQSSPEPREWLSNRQVIDDYDVSKATLARWRCAGLVRYSKVGSKIYYKRTDIAALLERHVVG